MRSVFLFVVCFVFATAAQEPPKAVLVDEFANVFCTDPLRARIDNFFQAISEKPRSVGYIVANADSSMPGRFQRYFNVFHNHARFRGFDVNRVKLYRGSDSDALRIKMWTAPPGVTPPDLPPDYRQQKVADTTLFDASGIHSIKRGKVEFGEYSESSEPCDWGLNLQQFAIALNADPNLEAYLVSSSDKRRSKSWVSQALRLTRNELSKKHRIAADRIKHIYAGRRENAIMQLWLVPKGSQPPSFRENSVP